MLNKNLLPIRDFKVAAAYTAVTLFLLWAIGYPVDEWAAATIVLYISLRLTWEIVIRLAAYLARALAGYGKSVLRQYGIPAMENRVGRRGLSRSGTATALAIAATATVMILIIGVALTAGFQIAAMYKLPSFPPYWYLASWVLLALGATGMLIAFGLPALVFAIADIRRMDWGAGNARLHAVAEGLAQAPSWIMASRRP